MVSTARRRTMVLAAVMALALVVLLNTSGLLDMGQHMNIIPIGLNRGASSPWNGLVQVSRLHLLIPASGPNVRLCYNLASAAVNRYPVPTLLGWNGQGEMNAAETHLAKLRAMKRYLDSLGAEEDDDLVLMVDGYDIIHQLPAEVMIERYFEVARKADRHLAQRMGISVGKLDKRDMKQTVFWGADKICWPEDPAAGRCWAAPPSFLEENAFGNHRPDDATTNDPRWLNSGTVMGPVSDMRRVINAAMDEIAATHDASFPQAESDQYYLANVWARQEYARAKQIAKGADVQGGPPDRVIPQKLWESQETELHMAIEYDSALFQTQAGNHAFWGYLGYNGRSYTSQVTVDLFGQGDKFVPFRVQMPSNVRKALTRLLEAIPETLAQTSAQDWVRKVPLGTNFVTKQIYGLWHCTGAKESIDAEFRNMWFYPFVQALVAESVRSLQRRDFISSQLVDGRRWVAKSVYPEHGDLAGEYGGAWSDEQVGGKFVPWKDLCGEHQGILFGGQQATTGT